MPFSHFLSRTRQEFGPQRAKEIACELELSLIISVLNNIWANEPNVETEKGLKAMEYLAAILHVMSILPPEDPSILSRLDAALMKKLGSFLASNSDLREEYPWVAQETGWIMLRDRSDVELDQLSSFVDVDISISNDREEKVEILLAADAWIYIDQLSSIDLTGLRDLFEYTNGASWHDSDQWMTPPALQTYQHWKGVTTDHGRGHVENLDLESNNLIGMDVKKVDYRAMHYALDLSDNHLD